MRLEKGDFVVQKLLEFLTKNKIKSGYLWIIGAVDYIKLALYELETKKYFEKEFKDAREIASLSGFISINKNKPYLHLHGTFCDKKFDCVGGHLKETRISATGEVYIKILNKKLTRYGDHEIGLDLLKISKQITRK